jgi:rod shape-determining protein MreC
VLSAGALVGEVTKVTPDTALVTLLTDESSAVTAYTIRKGALGIVESGEGGSLVLDNVPKDKDVTRGDLVATAGTGRRATPVALPTRDPDRHRDECVADRHGTVQADPDRVDG